MIWYPYEQMKTMKAPYKIVDAEGVYLYTEDNKMIDSISSWWSTIHGYKHPVITKAIKDQADKFSHVMLGGLTHDPALQLSAKLADWLPGDLDHCFFSDSGSVGVEVALKMALQYYVNQGDMERTKVLALQSMGTGAIIRKIATIETTIIPALQALRADLVLPAGLTLQAGLGLPALPANEAMGYETEMMIRLSFLAPLPTRSDR